MKIYILNAYGGYYDSSWDRILGAYDNEEIAELIRKNYIEKAAKIKENAPEVLYNGTNEEWDRTYKENYEYWDKNQGFEEDFVGIHIIETELNKEL